MRVAVLILTTATLVAAPAGILVSNTWQPNPPSTTVRVSLQAGLAFVSRIVGNAFSEFAPDLRDHFKQRHDREVN